MVGSSGQGKGTDSYQFISHWPPGGFSNTPLPHRPAKGAALRASQVWPVPLLGDDAAWLRIDLAERPVRAGRCDDRGVQGRCERTPEATTPIELKVGSLNGGDIARARGEGDGSSRRLHSASV
jgi:hypothetical protein